MKTYTIKKTKVTEDSWKTAEVALVNNSPWKEVKSPYNTKAQLLCDDEALYVHLETDETNIKAENNKRNSKVYEDSCMEFFISPDKDDDRYFNFEINAIGALLLTVCRNGVICSDVEEDSKIFDIKTVITKNGWELFYKIPFSFLTKYFDKISDDMKGNFFKCGDKTEVEHYACWSNIEWEKPNFHLSQFFGTLSYEK